MRLKSNLYVRTTPQGSSSHSHKDSPLWDHSPKIINFHAFFQVATCMNGVALLSST
jgi:hypothetical protein